MKRSRQIAKKVPAKAVSSEEEEEEEVQKNGPEWREVTADEWFKEEDGNSSFGDAEFGSSDEEPYDSADDEDDEEVYGSEDDEEEERAAREEEEDELNGGEEDEDEDEDDDQLNPENFQKLVSWLGRHDPPEAEESEDETHNTVGNVPMHWYADYPHIGYDVEGKKIMKKQGPVKDEMDRFLDRTDDPNYWRTIYDEKNDREIVLTKQDLEIIRKIKAGKSPSAGYDPYPELFEKDDKPSIFAVTNKPAPKSQFIPSKWEAKRVAYLVRAIKKGWINPKNQPKEKPQFYDIWSNDASEHKKNPMPLTAPKQRLPGHRESYNPPDEYLLSAKEIKKWMKKPADQRPPLASNKKFDALRKVPAYTRLINERFERCLDLYLVPRKPDTRKRVVDPENFLPKLPQREELRPFPTVIGMEYLGHSKRVRSVSFDPTGQFFASGSEDCTVRIWEVSSGRCLRVYNTGTLVTTVAWNPNPNTPVILAAVEEHVLILDSGVARGEIAQNVQELLNLKRGKVRVKEGKTGPFSQWTRPAGVNGIDKDVKLGLAFQKTVKQIAWHHKGDYFSTVAPEGDKNGVSIHQLSQQRTQYPFRRSKGQVQCAVFHPSKPIFFVASQRFIRVYDLLKQKLLTKLEPACKWVSSMEAHPGGDNVVVGSYDMRVCWFDLDLSSRPYKTIRNHKGAVRRIVFHPKYPLWATCSDDASLYVLHATVYADLLQNPLIVPLKRLKGHREMDGFGVLDCAFHPTQPWLLSAGADHTVKLWI